MIIKYCPCPIEGEHLKIHAKMELRDNFILVKKNSENHTCSFFYYAVSEFGDGPLEIDIHFFEIAYKNWFINVPLTVQDTYKQRLKYWEKCQWNSAIIPSNSLDYSELSMGWSIPFRSNGPNQSKGGQKAESCHGLKAHYLLPIQSGTKSFC